MATPPGLEPRLTQSECVVLPLDDGVLRLKIIYTQANKNAMSFLQTKQLHFVQKYINMLFQQGETYDFE